MRREEKSQQKAVNPTKIGINNRPVVYLEKLAAFTNVFYFFPQRSNAYEGLPSLILSLNTFSLLHRLLCSFLFWSWTICAYKRILMPVRKSLLSLFEVSVLTKHFFFHLQGLLFSWNINHCALKHLKIKALLLSPRTALRRWRCGVVMLAHEW